MGHEQPGVGTQPLHEIRSPAACSGWQRRSCSARKSPPRARARQPMSAPTAQTDGDGIAVKG